MALVTFAGPVNWSPHYPVQLLQAKPQVWPSPVFATSSTSSPTQAAGPYLAGVPTNDGWRDHMWQAGLRRCYFAIPHELYSLLGIEDCPRCWLCRRSLHQEVTFMACEGRGEPPPWMLHIRAGSLYWVSVCSRECLCGDDLAT